MISSPNGANAPAGLALVVYSPKNTDKETLKTNILTAEKGGRVKNYNFLDRAFRCPYY
jgi:hypothetical protein